LIQDEITMLNYSAAFGAVMTVMLAVDFFWLGFVEKCLYRDSIGPLMADRQNLMTGGGLLLPMIRPLLVEAVCSPVEKPDVSDPRLPLP